MILENLGVQLIILSIAAVCLLFIIGAFIKIIENRKVPGSKSLGEVLDGSNLNSAGCAGAAAAVCS